jgi:hypothetical protein
MNRPAEPVNSLKELAQYEDDVLEALRTRR